MSDDNKSAGGFLKGLIFKDTAEEAGSEEDVAPVPVPTSNGAAPALLSTFTTAIAPVASKAAGPSARTLEMLTEAQKEVPNDNAQFKLDAAMESIKALEPDATKRRTMALAILNSQGISSEKVEADAKKASQIMSGFITTLSSQLTAQRETAVVNVRTEANSLRAQATDLEAQITEIRNKQGELNTQAGVLEGNANAEEVKLNGVAAEIEAALAIIKSSAK